MSVWTCLIGGKIVENYWPTLAEAEFALFQGDFYGYETLPNNSYRNYNSPGSVVQFVELLPDLIVDD